MKTRSVYNDKCKKNLTQNQIKIDHIVYLNYFRKINYECQAPTPNLFCYEFILINSIILELWRLIHFYIFFKNWKMGVLKIKIEIWNFFLNIWRWHFKILNLEIGIFKNLFENSILKNWNFGILENLFENGILKMENKS